jgi:hypothetical protein
VAVTGESSSSQGDSLPTTHVLQRSEDITRSLPAEEVPARVWLVAGGCREPATSDGADRQNKRSMSVRQPD